MPRVKSTTPVFDNRHFRALDQIAREIHDYDVPGRVTAADCQTIVRQAFLRLLDALAASDGSFIATPIGRLRVVRAVPTAGVAPGAPDRTPKLCEPRVYLSIAMTKPTKTRLREGAL